MKVFCCLLASQRCKVVPAFMHFSAFVFSLQKWNDIGVCCSFCEKRIQDCEVFCCLFKTSEFLFETFSFCSYSEAKSNQKRNFFFFSVDNCEINSFSLFPNVSFFKQAKCCGNRLILLQLTRKKQRKPLFTIFSSKTTSFVSNLGKTSLTHKWNADF